MKIPTIAILAAALGFGYGTIAVAQTMPATEYNAAKKLLNNEYKSAKMRCDPMRSNAKDTCMAVVKGRDKVAHAELLNNYKPSVKNRYDLTLATADANYAVAAEKCDDQVGNAKDVCVKEAKSARVSAKADAKTKMVTTDASMAVKDKSVDARMDASKQIAEVRKDGADDKRDAEYAVAKEKCDALAGNAKDLCVTDAKTRYGK
jgi:hypothetical protein